MKYVPVCVKASVTLIMSCVSILKITSIYIKYPSSDWTYLIFQMFEVKVKFDHIYNFILSFGTLNYGTCYFVWLTF